MKALILSGGIASRLWPITYTRAKQLLPVANKPILFYAIESMVKAGIDDIGIIVGHTKDEIMQYIGDGSYWGIKITYIHQSKPEGLAHAVKVAQPFLKEEPFLMFLGDNIIRDDLSRFIQEFYIKKLNALVVLDQVKDPQNFGIAVLENGDIVELVEKPKEYIGNMAIVGVYLFDKNVFSAIDHLKPSWRNELEITDAIRGMIQCGCKVSYSQLEHWWKDTGEPRAILEANQKLLDELDAQIQGIVDDTSVIQGKVTIGENTPIENSIIKGPVIIGNDCRIKNAYIGPYTAIGNDCEVEDAAVEFSIVMEKCVVKHIETGISSSLIGSAAEILGQQHVPRTYSFFLADKSKVHVI